MLIALLVVFLILSFAMSIWALVIIFKRSIVGGVLSLFLGFPMLYYLVVGWNKEGDIKKPFFLAIIFYFIAIGAGVKLASSAAGELKELEMQAPAARRAPLFPEPAPTPAAAPRGREAPPAEMVRVRDAPAAQPVAAPRAPAPRRPQAAQGGCVYKPVMTDEDIAKCR